MPYLKGSAVVPASTSGDQVISNPFSSIANLKEFFDLVTDPYTWLRVAMVIGGFVLIIMAAVGLAKVKALGAKAAKVVSKGGESGGTGAS
jgi:hypothetical protein